MLAFILLLLIVVFNLMFYKSFLNPIFLQSIVWLVYYYCLYLNIDTYDIHLNNVTSFILLQSFGFSLGGFLCTLCTRTKSVWERKKPATKGLDNTYTNVQVIYPYVLLIIICSIIFLVKKVGSLSFFSIMEFRDSLAEDDGKNVGFIGLVQLLVSVYVIAYIASIKNIKAIWFKTVVLILLFLYFTLLLGSKGQFVSFFCATLYLLIWQKKISKSNLVIATSCFIGIIAFLFFLRAGGDEADIDKESMGNLVLVYTVTGMPAFYLSEAKPSLYFGYYTFRVVFVWLNKIGFSFPLSPVLHDFILTPLPTNVYSYLMPYYTDFGLAGVFFMPLLLGIIHNLLYFRSNKGSLSSMILSAMFLFPLIMQVFDENYFRQFTNWVYVFILIKLITQLKISAGLKKVGLHTS